MDCALLAYKKCAACNNMHQGWALKMMLAFTAVLFQKECNCRIIVSYHEPEKNIPVLTGTKSQHLHPTFLYIHKSMVQCIQKQAAVISAQQLWNWPCAWFSVPDSSDIPAIRLETSWIWTQKLNVWVSQKFWNNIAQRNIQSCEKAFATFLISSIFAYLSHSFRSSNKIEYIRKTTWVSTKYHFKWIFHLLMEIS